MPRSIKESYSRENLIKSYLTFDPSKLKLEDLESLILVGLEGTIKTISIPIANLLSRHFGYNLKTGDLLFDIVETAYLEAFLKSFRTAISGTVTKVFLNSHIPGKKIKFQIHPIITEEIQLFQILVSEEEIGDYPLEISAKNRDEAAQVFESLFNNHPDAIYSFDLEGFFTSANASALKLGEFSRDEMIDHNMMMDLIPEADKERVISHFKMAARGTAQNYTTRFTSFKGKKKIINIINFPIIINGAITGVFGIAKDVTETETIKKQADLLENRYKTILDQSLDVICTIDKNGCFLELNKACLNMWGYQVEELIGKNYMELVVKEDRGITQLSANEIMHGKDESNFTNRYVRKDGTIVPMVWSSRWVEEEQIYYSIAKNASEMNAVKHKLEEERNMLRAIIDNIPDYIFVKNKNHESILANKKFYNEYLGKESEDEILGLKPSDYFPEKEGILIMDDNRIVMESDLPVINRKDIVVDHNGNKEVILLTKVPFKTIDGEVIGLVGIARNITESYKLEEEQKLTYDLIEVLGRADNLDSALKGTIRKISKFFNFEHAQALEIGNGPDALKEIAVYNKDRAVVNSSDLKKQLSQVANSALHSKEIIIHQNQGLDKKVFIGLPILFDKKVIQVLSFQGKRNEGFFEDVAKFLKRLGIQIAGGIQRKITETQLNHLFKHSPTLIAVIGLDGYLRKASPSFTKTFGYSEEELLATPYFEFLHPEEVHVSFERLKEVSQGFMPRSFEGRCRCKDGSWKWVSWTPSEIMSEDGMINLFGLDITALKTGNLELLKYKNIIESSSEGVLLITLENKEVYLNSSLLRTLGHNANTDLSPEYIKSSFTNQGLGEEIFNRLLDGEYLNTEIEVVNVDGAHVEFQFSGGPVFNQDQELIAVYGIYSDITERRNSEKELKKYNEQVSNILESITDGFFSINKDWIVTYFNKEAEKLLRVPKESILNKYIWDYFPEAKDSLSYKKYSMALKTGKKVSFQDYFEPYDTWFEVNAYPSATGLSVYFKDITAKKKVDEEIKIAKERYDLVTKVTHEAIYDWDMINNSLEWSKAYFSAYGYKIPPPDKGLEHWENQLHPDDRDKVNLSLENALANSLVNIWEFEYKLIKANKEISIVIDRGLITRDKDGNPIRMIGSLQDITQLKQNEIALETLNGKLKLHADELAVSNAELEQFAYIASHDLQEPLRMVTSFLTQLNKKYKDQLDPKAQQYIYYATDGAIRMRQILLDLLEYSRVGRMNYQLEEIDLNVMLTDILKLHGDLISEMKGEVLFKNLPIIHAAPSPIQRVLSNLITNALKYQKAGSVPTIHITVAENPGFWQINVKDNGIGIEKQFFDKIFVVFQRLHSKDEYSGTGIGLAICRKIIENHGGRIWVTSKINEGSTFHITIKKQF